MSQESKGNQAMATMCKTGPFFLGKPSKWPCVGYKWELVTLSLLQTPTDGHTHTLTVVAGDGKCLYTMYLPQITMKKMKYNNSCHCSGLTCCTSKSKSALNIIGENNENIVLWAEEEDLEGWEEIIANAKTTKNDPINLDKAIGNQNHATYKTRLGQFYGVSSSCSVKCKSHASFKTGLENSVYESADLGTSEDIIATTREDDTSNSADGVPGWVAMVPRVDRKESDMITFDYDEMFKELKPLLANKNRGTFQVVTSVTRQLISTMNPSKVRLPACVLECRSLLESYADAFSRPELFTSISNGTSPADRLLRVTAFYLSQLKCMRPVKCVSKPYNPVLGEYFVCTWPEFEFGDVHFVAEQVSHHPPVSAFHAVCHDADISLTSAILTKSGIITSAMPPFIKALTVACEGETTLHLGSHEEVYTMTYPTAVATNVLSSSGRLLLSGQISISCSSNLGRVDLTFVEESLVHGIVYDTESGEQVATVGGNWRQLVELFKENVSIEKKGFKAEIGSKREGESKGKTENKKEVKREEGDDNNSVDGSKTVLLDMRYWDEPETAKIVPTIATQGELESRRLWRLLTRSLAGYMSEIEADTAKRSVEDWARQRGPDEITLQYFEVDRVNPLNVRFKFLSQE